MGLKEYAKAQKITLSKADEQLFKKVVGKAWSYRAADSCYTKLAEVKKKHGWNWKEDTLVLSAGQSIDFMQCCKEIFPHHHAHGGIPGPPGWRCSPPQRGAKLGASRRPRQRDAAHGDGQAE